MQYYKPAPIPLQLRPHQIEHTKRILEMLKKFFFFVDGSEMGTGKTYVAAALAITLGLPCIVICPVAARKTWQDVFDTYGVQVYQLPETGGIITYETLRSKKGYQPKHGLITRDDSSKSTEFYPTHMLTQIIQAGVLVLFDECQKLKNQGNQNKAAKAIIRQIYALGGRSRIGLLSGSALDKEVQSISFLKMVGFISSRNLYTKTAGQIHLEGIQELHDWSRRIDAEGTAKFIAEHGTPSTRDQATNYVFNLFISVIKPGVMSIMPRPDYEGRKDVKNGHFILSTQDDLDYQRAINGLATTIRFNPENGSIVIDSMGAITTALVNLQQAKMRAMARVAREELLKQHVNEQGQAIYPKVILYADYHEILDFFKQELKEFNPLEITGKLTEKKRNDNITKFQEHNPNFRLLIGNPLAGGIGINLHDTDGRFPRMMYIMPGYRINELHQATGRVFRDGLKGNATIRFFYGLSSLHIKESSILDALSRKGQTMKSVHSEQSEYGMKFINELDSYFEVQSSNIANGPMINQATSQMNNLNINY